MQPCNIIQTRVATVVPEEYGSDLGRFGVCPWPYEPNHLTRIIPTREPVPVFRHAYKSCAMLLDIHVKTRGKHHATPPSESKSLDGVMSVECLLVQVVSFLFRNEEDPLHMCKIYTLTQTCTSCWVSLSILYYTTTTLVNILKHRPCHTVYT